MAPSGGSFRTPLLADSSRGADDGGEWGHPTGFSSAPAHVWTGRLIFSAVAAVMGGTFQFGYNTGVINNAKEAVQAALSGCTQEEVAGGVCVITVTQAQWSLAVSLFAVGGLVGGLGTGPVMGRVGRKITLLSVSVIMILGAVITALARNIAVLLIGRVLIGVGSGAATGVTPLYLTEVAPVSIRGALGTMSQLGIVGGILISSALGLSNVLGNLTGFRYLLGLPVVPGLFLVAAFFFLPESPRWLYLARERPNLARASLTQLRGASFDPQTELDDMQREKEKAGTRQALSIVGLLRSSELRRTLLIGLGLQGAQQLTGINAVFYFSTSIFKQANVPNGDVATTGVAVVNVVMTLAAVYLIDRAGRRSLLTWGLGIMIVFFIALTVSLLLQEKAPWLSYVAVVSVVGVVIGFAIGPGAIPWLMVGEIFPATAISSATSLCVGANWAFNFVIGISFESIQSALGNYTFLVFSVTAGLFLVFVRLVVPETKGRSIDEVSAVLTGRTAKEIEEEPAVTELID